MDENEKRSRREKKSSDLAMKIFPLLIISKSDSQDQISRVVQKRLISLRT